MTPSASLRVIIPESARVSTKSMAQGSMFEALFTRALTPEGEFLAALREAGFDPQKPRAEYPTEVWVKALEIARKHVFPNETPQVAYRKIGRRFTDGFLSTLAGKVVLVALPFMNPASFMKRMPRYLQMGRNDMSMEVEVQETNRTATAHLTDPFAVPPDFMAGILEVGLEKLKASGGVQVRVVDPRHYVLELHW